MRFFIIAVVSLCIGCASSAQIKKSIKKSYAFITEISMGNMPVDATGKELLPQTYTSIQLFAELATTKSIKWDTIWYNQKAYKADAFEMTQAEIKAGVFKGTGMPAIIKVSKGNKLVQLNLTPIEEALKSSSKNYLLSGGTLLITGKNKGIAFSHNAGVPAQLEAIPSM